VTYNIAVGTNTDPVPPVWLVYERFSVNGMRSQHMGANTGYGNEGDYIANPRNMTALAPVWDAAHNLSWLCLTSAYDVAQFVVRAIDMPTWAPEMSMHGERMTVNELLEVIRVCRSGFAYLYLTMCSVDIMPDRQWASVDYQDAPSAYPSLLNNERLTKKICNIKWTRPRTMEMAEGIDGLRHLLPR